MDGARRWRGAKLYSHVTTIYNNNRKYNNNSNSSSDSISNIVDIHT